MGCQAEFILLNRTSAVVSSYKSWARLQFWQAAGQIATHRLNPPATVIGTTTVAHSNIRKRMRELESN